MAHSVLERLLSLPIRRQLLILGAGMIALACGVRYGAIHIAVPTQLIFFFAIGGFQLILIAAAISEAEKNRALARERIDAELREARMAAGLDPDSGEKTNDRNLEC